MVGALLIEDLSKPVLVAAEKMLRRGEPEAATSPLPLLFFDRAQAWSKYRARNG
jgi:hypothetical protein